MVKKISILSLFAILLVVTGCEKCSKPNMTDPFYNAEYSEEAPTTRGGEFDGPSGGDLNPNGGITDPNEGGDFDGIVDPNEGEDFDGIVDPNEDEDFDSDGK